VKGEDHDNTGLGCIRNQLRLDAGGGRSIAWVLVLPGTILLDSLIGLSKAEVVVPILTLSALRLLLLSVFAGFAYDIQRQKSSHQAPSMRG
jgi:hypothetical protein